MQKTLILLRHAKTEAGSSHQDDQSRKLIERGLKATRIVGSYMRKNCMQPQLVLCSTAIRTTETLLGIEHEYAAPLPVKYIEKLYLASAAEMLNIIATATDDISELLVIGHNPGIHELCMKLAKSGDEALIDRMAIKFPTCAVARFICHTPDWATIRDARTELVSFVSPKMLGQVIV